MKSLWVFIHILNWVFFFQKKIVEIDMGDGNESSRTTGMEQLSLQSNRYSRDLLQRFMATNPRQSPLPLPVPVPVPAPATEEGVEEEDEIELNLGLSLGGRFGVDRSEKKRLMRSSSIAGCLPAVREEDETASVRAPVVNPGLARTSSLPVETEEEWRKRKELQTMRRMEAKRRRSEKQRSKETGDGAGGGGLERGFEEEKREIESKLRGKFDKRDQLQLPVPVPVPNNNRFAPPHFGFPSWAARHGVLAGSSAGAGAGGGGEYAQPSSQGSMGSQGGSSSGISELESKVRLGSSSCGETSPASIQSLQERCNQEAAAGGSSGAKMKEAAIKSPGPEKKLSPTSKRPNIVAKERSNTLEDMPCVFTKGDGPNGRRVEGILYKYGKGEEVRIMCVCHGSFLSPAEFVRHAGGTDVDHPLKHIVVNPNSASFS